MSPSDSGSVATMKEGAALPFEAHIHHRVVEANRVGVAPLLEALFICKDGGLSDVGAFLSYPDSFNEQPAVTRRESERDDSIVAVQRHAAWAMPAAGKKRRWFHRREEVAGSPRSSAEKTDRGVGGLSS